MFNLKENNQYDIISPVDGKLISLDDIADEMFSKRMLGNGIAIIPLSELIVAPIDGIVTMLADTKHAFGIENGRIEMLVHIGIDTVYLEGKGLEKLINAGDNVKKGEPIIKMNKRYIEEMGYDDTIILVVTKNNTFYSFEGIDNKVACKDVIGKYY